jgi:hypothetical protein
MLLMAGCSNNGTPPPAGIIPVDSMSVILAEIHILEAYANYPSLQDSMAINYEKSYEALFERTGVTRERYDISYDYYVQSPEKMNTLYEKVINALSERENMIAKP